MLNLSNAEWLFTTVILIFVYFISLTINGLVQTLVSSKLGDRTAENAGYLSFNPLIYFEPIRFIFLLIFGASWPNSVPNDLFNITGPNRMLKLFTIFITEGFTYFIMALTALASVVYFYGNLASFEIAKAMFYPNISILKLANFIFPQEPTMSLVITLILITFASLNIFMAVLSLIINAFRYFLVLGLEKRYSYIEYADYFMLFGSIFVFFFANPLRYFLLKTIMLISSKII